MGTVAAGADSGGVRGNGLELAEGKALGHRRTIPYEGNFFHLSGAPRRDCVEPNRPAHRRYRFAVDQTWRAQRRASGRAAGHIEFRESTNEPIAARCTDL